MPLILGFHTRKGSRKFKEGPKNTQNNLQHTHNAKNKRTVKILGFGKMFYSSHISF